MNKKIKIQLPSEKPDKCANCPLLGMIPKELKSKDKKDRFKSYICIGTKEALTKKFIYLSASERDKFHKLHRPCDYFWKIWQEFPLRKIEIDASYYTTFILPYEQSGLKPLLIRFHERK